MECNKDEAKRAMDIAERKITEKDYNGAKKFADKAQNLFPNLEGLKQLLMIIEVYISGEKKVAGEADWYGILGVDPCVEDEALRKQYLKLALMLHPDKNKSQGADGAFKLILEAWSLLKDSVKRKSYEEKRNQGSVSTTQRPNPSHGFEPEIVETTPRGRKGRSTVGSAPFSSSMQKESSVKESQQGFSTTQSWIPPPPQERESSTFWTKCDKCKKLHEYQRVYVNQHLRCKTCHDSFIAVEIIPKSCTFWTQCDKCKTHYQHQWVYIKKLLVCPTCQGSFVAEEKPPPSCIPEAANVSSNQQERDATFTDSDMRDSKRMKTDDSHVS